MPSFLPEFGQQEGNPLGRIGPKRGLVRRRPRPGCRRGRLPVSRVPGGRGSGTDALPGGVEPGHRGGPGPDAEPGHGRRLHGREGGAYSGSVAGSVTGSGSGLSVALRASQSSMRTSGSSSERPRISSTRRIR